MTDAYDQGVVVQAGGHLVAAGVRAVNPFKEAKLAGQVADDLGDSAKAERLAKEAAERERKTDEDGKGGARSFRRVCAESLFHELVRPGARGSISSVYRNLRDFSAAGLLKRVPIYGSTAWFDTQIGHHHHFYAEEEDRLMDVPVDGIKVDNVPSPPDGYELVGVDVLLRGRRRELPLDG